MPFDLSHINLGLVGWLLIGAAAIVLGAALLRLFGHLFHLLVRGCGFVLLGVIVLYVLRLLNII